MVSVLNEGKAALFFTGRKHAGENLEDLLKKRNGGLQVPIQMCDALSRNAPKEFQALMANCLAHGRRQFVDIAENFPEECIHVLEELKKVYQNEARVREQQMTAEERLHFHQTESGPVMESLFEWFTRQFEEKKVEPNSGLGKAIQYMLNHWKKLTLFLREANAPLDNNICERALKKAIQHRKNSLFYKTMRGAAVGDLYMSLIHTCYFSGADPFDYLTQLQRNHERVAAAPADWMPWNYRQQLVSAEPASGPACGTADDLRVLTTHPPDS